MKKRITIFTPTYNRAYILDELYQSLCKQNSQDFEWLIVDDGSKDNTKNLVESFIKENRISIKYFFQKNGGKHRAINKGVEKAEGELFFIVDSDDSLTTDSIESILISWDALADKTQYSGLCFRKKYINTDLTIGKKFPYHEFDSNSLDMEFKLKIAGDMALIYKTTVLKQYHFPEIIGENFVPEGLVWLKIAHSGLFLRCIDKAIYRCEYLPDGLTKNFSSNLKRNPKGFMLYYKSLFKYKECPLFPNKIKALIRILQCYFYKITK